MPLPAAFQHATEHVARAEAAAETTAAALRATQAKLDQIDARVGALQTERAAIISRRTAGQHEADDAAALALINGDLEGLGNLRANAETGGSAHRHFVTVELAEEEAAPLPVVVVLVKTWAPPTASSSLVDSLPDAVDLPDALPGPPEVLEKEYALLWLVLTVLPPANAIEAPPTSEAITEAAILR